jgi:hypothetical protein
MRQHDGGVPSRLAIPGQQVKTVAAIERNMAIGGHDKRPAMKPVLRPYHHAVLPGMFIACPEALEGSLPP